MSAMPSGSDSFRSNLDLVVVNIVGLLVLSFGMVHTYALYDNRLAVHSEWSSTKPTLSRPVMGAFKFVSSQQALARNRLNLGSWFGFQEVLYREPMDFEKLEFLFRFEGNGYVHALFDYRDTGFSGVRLSSRLDFPSCVYRATPEGEFAELDVLALRCVTPDAWHHAHILFGDERADIFVDGERVGVVARSPGPQRFGFRGGQRNAWIDDISITHKDGRIQVESFTNTSNRWRRLMFVFGVLFLLALVGATAARRLSSISWRTVGLGIMMTLLTLGFAVACGYGLQYLSAGNYSLLSDDSRKNEAYWINSRKREILDDIRTRYPADIPPGALRILVLGASQTWGAGARSLEDMWPLRLEKKLNEQGRGPRFELINAGVSGFVAKHVLQLLQKDLKGFQATAALVNISSNDTDPAQFERDLEEIILELTNRKIRSILTLEPNSPERRITDSPQGDLAAKHAVVRGLAARYGLNVIDLNGYLAERKDAGFLWWDFVHLTSFGHRLVAEKLAEDLPPLLGLPD